MECGVVSVPADRRQQGLVLSLQIEENVTLPDVAHFRNRTRRIVKKKERSVTGDLMEQFLVRGSSPDALVGSLSGGNQQKVLLAKWLRLARACVVLHEPTQGVDVAARAEIYSLIKLCARERKLVIFVVSGDGEELAALCDRVYVLREGSVVTELVGASIDTNVISEVALGA